MRSEIKVPAMGESITEATVGEIIKKSGSKVNVDDEILELETDKVNQVLYAPENGTLSLNVKTDDVVKIGQIIGYVDIGEGAPVKEIEQPKPAPTSPPPAPPPPPPRPATESIRESKEEYIQQIAEKPTLPKAPPVGERRETRKRMTKIRRVIAERLVEAQQSTAMLTTFNEVDLSRVIELRDRYKDIFQKEHGVKLGFMSFFIKAAVFALHEVPGINSYIAGDEIVHREYFDIGVAVGTDRGLVVPVIRDCDKLTFAQIEAQLAEYAKQAREGTISLSDLQGGGFTITNGGIYGSMLSTPILNPPQAGIFGMHKIQKRAVVIDDEIVIRPMMYLALSYDHRIVDGKEAVTFLVHIKESLEDPARLMLEV